MKIGISVLQNQQITLEVDENPNGLPVLWIHTQLNVHKGPRTIAGAALSKEQVEQLIEELQKKLKEM